MPTALSEEEFVRIENSNLFALIRKKIRPTSTVDFVRKFTSKLIFSIPPDFVQAYNFQLWITYVKVYFREVLTRYEFLSEELDPKLLPPCTFKDDGLIELILRPMIPFHVAKNIHFGFYNKGSKCKNILEYIDSQIIIKSCSGINSMISFDENIFKEGISHNLDKISREFRENNETFEKIRHFLNQLMRNESKDQSTDETHYIKVHPTEKSGSTLQITKKRIQMLKPLLEKVAIQKNGEKTIIFSENVEIPLKDIRFISPSKTTDEIEFPQLTRITKKMVSLKESMSPLPVCTSTTPGSLSSSMFVTPSR
jgi:hypothetical protein